MHLSIILIFPVLSFPFFFLLKEKQSFCNASLFLHAKVFSFNAAHISEVFYRKKAGIEVQSAPAGMVVFIHFVAFFFFCIKLIKIKSGPHKRKIPETFRD